MSTGNFFAELKRRNVYKVALAYTVIAWLLLEIAAILLPIFESPEGLMELLVIALAAGAAVSLIVAWLFEMTPQGMKRTENISPNEVIPYWSKRKFTILIVSISLLAAALTIFQNLHPARRINNNGIGVTDHSF